MPDANATTERGDNPDHFLVGRLPRGDRLPTDGGPRYKETPALEVLTGPNPPAVAEPFNAVTASFFVLIAVAWGGRVLRAGVDKHPFVASMMPVLLAGGIGGTLYHAFRSRFAYFLLDVVPISLLGLAGGVYLAVRLWRRKGWLYLFASAGAYAAMNALFLFLLAPVPALARFRTLAVNVSYASLAVVVIIPLVAILVRTRFRHGGLVVAALASFAVAWFCRLVDGSGLTDLPMGTHWLWHTFGAVTTALTVEYFFRLEREGV